MNKILYIYIEADYLYKIKVNTETNSYPVIKITLGKVCHISKAIQIIIHYYCLKLVYSSCYFSILFILIIQGTCLSNSSSSYSSFQSCSAF